MSEYCKYHGDSGCYDTYSATDNAIRDSIIQFENALMALPLEFKQVNVLSPISSSTNTATTKLHIPNELLPSSPIMLYELIETSLLLGGDLSDWRDKPIEWIHQARMAVMLTIKKKINLQGVNGFSINDEWIDIHVERRPVEEDLFGTITNNPSQRVKPLLVIFRCRIFVPHFDGNPHKSWVTMGKGMPPPEFNPLKDDIPHRKPFTQTYFIPYMRQEVVTYCSMIDGLKGGIKHVKYWAHRQWLYEEEDDIFWDILCLYVSAKKLAKGGHGISCTELLTDVLAVLAKYDFEHKPLRIPLAEPKISPSPTPQLLPETDHECSVVAMKCWSIRDRVGHSRWAFISTYYDPRGVLIPLPKNSSAVYLAARKTYLALKKNPAVFHAYTLRSVSKSNISAIILLNPPKSSIVDPKLERYKNMKHHIKIDSPGVHLSLPLALHEQINLTLAELPNAFYQSSLKPYGLVVFLLNTDIQRILCDNVVSDIYEWANKRLGALCSSIITQDDSEFDSVCAAIRSV